MSSTFDDSALEASVRARVGTVLRGKYTINAVLGIGGMAAVYSATHRNGRQLAVKLLHPQLSNNAEARTRFAREGLVANTIRHPGVVTILDDDVTEDGAAFLVMELLEGATLEELWERCGRRLPLPAVVAAGIALLDILSAAHASGVVHRDVKPANLFLTQGWQLKVLDFGISRLAALSSTQTQGGLAMGSPAFMAPEQALGRLQEIDARTDVWAVGACLFALASGSYVHEGQTGQEMLIRAATTPVRSLSSVMPSVPALVALVIDRALAFRREERWASAAEMSVALAEAARASFGEEPSAAAFASILPLASGAAPMPTPLPVRVSSIPAPNLSTQLTSTTSGSNRPGPMLLAQRRRTMVAAGVVGLALLIGVSALVVRSGHSAPAGALATAASAGSGTAGSASAPTASGATAAPPPAASAPSAEPVAGDEPVAPTATAHPAAAGHGQSSHASTTPRAPAPAAAPVASAAQPARPATTSSFLPQPRVVAPPPDPCNPPYRYDFFGNKVPKAGCPPQ